MMHTPDDPIRAELRATLRELWKHLMPMHRALIDAARDDYATMIAPVNGPNHLLQLLQEEPFFEWLRPMTSLIVDVDTLSRTDFQRSDVDDLAARLERLFGSAAEPSFKERYLPVLQRELDVAAGHAAVRRLLERLSPKTAR